MGLAAVPLVMELLVNLMRRGHHLIMRLRWQEIRHHALKVVVTPTIATPSRDVIIRLAKLNSKKILKNLPGFQLGIISQKKTNIVLTALPKVVITLQNFTVIVCAQILPFAFSHCILMSYHVFSYKFKLCCYYTVKTCDLDY